MTTVGRPAIAGAREPRRSTAQVGDRRPAGSGRRHRVLSLLTACWLAVLVWSVASPDRENWPLPAADMFMNSAEGHSQLRLVAYTSTGRSIILVPIDFGLGEVQERSVVRVPIDFELGEVQLETWLRRHVDPQSPSTADAALGRLAGIWNARHGADDPVQTVVLWNDWYPFPLGAPTREPVAGWTSR